MKKYLSLVFIVPVLFFVLTNEAKAGSTMVASTSPATLITQTSAQLNGDAISLGNEPFISPAFNLYTNDTIASMLYASSVNSSGPVSVFARDLTCDTEYSFEFLLGSAKGDKLIFKTLPCDKNTTASSTTSNSPDTSGATVELPPVIQTDEADTITKTTANLNAHISEYNGISIKPGFQLFFNNTSGISSSSTIAAKPLKVSGQGTTFKVAVKNLLCGTQYSVDALGKTKGSTTWDDSADNLIIFTTLPCDIVIKANSDGVLFSGPSLSLVEQIFTSLGYFDEADYGLVGNNTFKSIVKLYQYENRLKPTGIFDAKTVIALNKKLDKIRSTITIPSTTTIGTASTTNSGTSSSTSGNNI